MGGRADGDRALLWIVAIVLAAVGVWWLYRVEAASRRPSVRLLLGAVRLAVLGVVAVMLLEPILIFSHVEHEPSNMIVLLDNSRSMGLRDAWQAQSAGQALADVSASPRRRPRSPQVDAARTGAAAPGPGPVEPARIGRRSPRPHPSLRRPPHGTARSQADRCRTQAEPPAIGAPATDGQSTAIGSAVRQAVLAYRGKPIAGILLISDGQSNVGESAVEAARFAAEERIPFVALGAGTEEGPRNVAIKSIETSPVVFERDHNNVTVLVESSGMPEMPATVVLEKRRLGEQWQEIGREDITLRRDGRLQSASFRYAEEQPGKIELRAKILDVGPELTQDDNVAVSEVRVVRQKLRVLLIAGSTFPEIQFLRNTLLRDKTMELSTWLMSADATYDHPGSVPIRRLPIDAGGDESARLRDPLRSRSGEMAGELPRAVDEVRRAGRRRIDLYRRRDANLAQLRAAIGAGDELAVAVAGRAGTGPVSDGSDDEALRADPLVAGDDPRGPP